MDLLGQHAPDGLVAFGGDGDRMLGELLADAARIRLALPPASDVGIGFRSHVLLVFERDRYAMAAALLAVLDRGHAVALAPNARRDAVLAVARRSETCFVLHDTDSGFGASTHDLLSAESDVPPTPLRAPFEVPTGVIATVFTSGTTGPMTAWSKTRDELVGEAAALARRFGIAAGDRIVGTVAPGHIYGLLFTILLPLLRGGSFSRDTPHHAEAIAGRVAASRANVLVTVPVQLRALAALPEGALAGLERVFCSTGPLPDQIAERFSKRHALAVSEILGSTETGGIASRERMAGLDPLWQPFPEVVLSRGRDDRLRVDSPFLFRDLPRPFETADRVRFEADGRFAHLGRVDGVVKIGGRRISIQEVEEYLRQQPGVDEAAVVAIEVEGARGHQLLAAVAPAACSVAALRKALLERFEPSCLPRRILPVDALPLDASGKLPRDRLLRLFGLRPDGRPQNWSLDWDEPVRREEAGRSSFEWKVKIPSDYAWFEGHSMPILCSRAPSS